MVYLTRRVSFASAHRYRRVDWSEERNEQVFGSCARQSFHGHSYVCDVTVAGTIEPETGMIVDLGLLDRVLATEVRERFDHRNINLDVPDPECDLNYVRRALPSRTVQTCLVNSFGYGGLISFLVLGKG